MTAVLAIIAAAGIILLIRAIVVMDRATKVMSEVAVKAREVHNLAAAIKAQNDAMRERNVLKYDPRHSVGDGNIYRGPNWYC